MLCLRAALKRHFMDGRQWDIINDVEFARANNALDGILKKHKRDGELKAVSHKPVIIAEDFEKMMNIFLRNKEPEMLVMQVWFFVTFHFGLRGRELQRSLRKDDLQIQLDERGRKFIQICVDRATKNHPGGIGDRADPPIAGRITGGNQVFAVEFLLKHLHPDQEALFQMAKKKVTKLDKVWFVNAPIGKNTLGCMMQRISKACDLGQVYTNHSVRATVVHRLSAAGTPERHIMSVTGHKNPQSLQSYARATDNQQDQMASVLDGRAAVVASRNPDVQLDEADMEAAALAVADLDSCPLEPASNVQKSAVSVSSISNDASRHLNLAHGALQPINFNGSVGTCNITINVVPEKGL